MKRHDVPQAIAGSILLGLALITLGAKLLPPDHEAHDLVILNGRVIDPETGFDAVANVAIEDGRIAAISTSRSRR